MPIENDLSGGLFSISELKKYISVTTIILASLRAYKPKFWRYNPAQCAAYDRAHAAPPDQCCGKYPERYPYHSDDKQCCKGW